MSRLILIRHAETQQDPSHSARDWTLTEQGHRDAEALVKQLGTFTSTAVIASPHPKTSQTAGPLAAHFNLPIEIHPDLREHDRTGVPFMTQNAFLEAVHALMRHPNEQIMGGETANEAHDRFSAALVEIVSSHPSGNLFIFTHATVMSLFHAHHTGCDPFAFWQSLGMPGWVIYDLPDYEVIETVLSLH